MLFAIQLIRIAFWFLPAELSVIYIYDSVIVIHQMLNVIIRSVHIWIYFFCFTDNIYQGIAPTIILVRVSMRLSFDDPESFKEAAGSLRFNNSPSDPNTSMPPQLGPQGPLAEISEDTQKIWCSSKLLYNIREYNDTHNFNLNIIWAAGEAEDPMIPTISNTDSTACYLAFWVVASSDVLESYFLRYLTVRSESVYRSTQIL